jgi:hypothetical protein
MSEKDDKTEKARRLWDSAIEALQELRNVDEETLREIAKTRTRMPVIVIGQKGRTNKGITVAAYTKTLGLGSELPVKADLPKEGLKAYILEYIDRVNMLKAGDEPKQRTANPSHGEMDDQTEYFLQEALDIEWMQDLNAFRLPPLSKDTLTAWADQITDDIKEEGSRYGDDEFAEIESIEQYFSTGFPLEIEKLIVKNYKKAMREKMGRIPRLAAQRAENNASLSNMAEEWKAFLKGEVLSSTWITSFESGAVREAVGKKLKEIVTISP